MQRTISRDALERLRKRFAKHCRAKHPLTGCIETRYSIHTGYPRLWVDGRSGNARKVAYLLSGRILAQGMRVFVVCGNPKCVNVEDGHVVAKPWPLKKES